MPAPIRVLIVDDNASVRLMLSRTLSRRSDLEIVGEAESGELACETAAATGPDVVLMDVMMAGIGGVEAAKRLAAAAPDAAVIGVSAVEEGPALDEMRAAGAVDFVPKTASVDQLVMAIQAAAAVQRHSAAQKRR